VLAKKEKIRGNESDYIFICNGWKGLKKAVITICKQD
jgi:hypothetical protein